MKHRMVNDRMVKDRMMKDWFAPLLAGLLPVLVGGMVASALANRLAFAAWALVLTVAYTALWRFAADLGWERRWATGGGLVTLGLGSVAFAALVERHGEILDLGFRALLPALYHPLLTRPATYLALAAALTVAGALRFSLPARSGRPPARQPSDHPGSTS